MLVGREIQIHEWVWGKVLYEVNCIGNYAVGGLHNGFLDNRGNGNEMGSLTGNRRRKRLGHY